MTWFYIAIFTESYTFIFYSLDSAIKTMLIPVHSLTTFPLMYKLPTYHIHLLLAVLVGTAAVSATKY